ncbi:MAG: hypothetical protein ABIM58_05790 [candidate division WOR-3 bacterium]
MNKIFKKIILTLIIFSACKGNEKELRKVKEEVDFLKNKVSKIEIKIDSIKKNFDEYKKNIESRILILEKNSKKERTEFRHPWEKNCNKCH